MEKKKMPKYTAKFRPKGIDSFVPNFLSLMMVFDREFPIGPSTIKIIEKFAEEITPTGHEFVCVKKLP